MEAAEETIPYDIDNVRNMQQGPRKKRNPGGATIARMTSKGQMTVPKRVREFMGLEPGDAVLISMLGPDVTMRRITPLDEWERPPIPEHLRDLTDAEQQELIDEGYRQRWREKAARESEEPRHEGDEAT